nr:hypothetical protein [uncultured Clostridium sp.]
MTITVDIRGLEPIVEAMNNLAQALGAKGVEATFRETTGQAPVPAAPAIQTLASPQGAYYQAPGMSPMQPSQTQATPAAPMNQVPIGAPSQVPQGGMPSSQQMVPTQGQIPTTAIPQSYTQDQIAVAMTGLVDRGMQPVVMQILGQFGALSLQQLTKEQYPALVAELRKAGANI